MRKEIISASFFATIMLLAQLTTITSTAVADETNVDKNITKLSDDYTIPLSDEELDKLENAIENFTGTELHDDLILIYDSSLEGNNEFKVSGLSQMLVSLKSVDGSYFTDLTSVISFNDLLMIIVQLIVGGVFAIPFEVLDLIMKDVIDLVNYYISCLAEPEFLVATAIAVFSPKLYDLLIELNILKDYFVKIVPDTENGKREYVVSKIKEATSAISKMIVEEVASCFVNEYLKPKMGYLTVFVEEFSSICVFSVQLVKDAKIGFKYFKTIFVDLPKTFVDFVDVSDKEIIADFTDFLHALKATKTAAEDWHDDMENNGGPGVLADIALIAGDLFDLYMYYKESPQEPWMRPIEVAIEVEKNSGDEIFVSFDSPAQHSSATITYDEYDAVIIYYTNNTNNPYGIHSFTVVADNDGAVKTYQTWAFSDGAVKIDFDFTKAKSIVQTPFLKLKEKLSNFAEFFQNIFSTYSILLKNMARSLPSPMV